MKAFVRVGIAAGMLAFAACGSKSAGSGGNGGPGGTSLGGSGGMLGPSDGGAAPAGTGGPAPTGGGGMASDGRDGRATAEVADGGGMVVDVALAPPADAGVEPSDAAAAACPASGTLKSGTSTQTMSFGGAMRSYIIHIPPQYDGKTRLPLIFDMHGQNQTAQAQMGTSGWLAKADAAGIVMIYPQGLYNSWNAGPAGCPTLMCCCQPAQDHAVDDAGFLRAVVAKTAQDGCIDLKRVYATGLSNGGCMSHWVGCDIADVFAAVAPVSCGNMIDCKPSRPVTVVEYRGRQDNIVPYNGGMIGPTTHNWPSAMTDFIKWSTLDMCSDAPRPLPLRPICQVTSKCGDGAEVILCSPDTGHVLYGDAAKEMAAVPDLAWEVFQQHPLP